MSLQFGGACLAHGTALRHLDPLSDAVLAEDMPAERGHWTRPLAQTDGTMRTRSVTGVVQRCSRRRRRRGCGDGLKGRVRSRIIQLYDGAVQVHL